MASELFAAVRTSWRNVRDLWLDGYVGFNLLCLTGDIALAHSSNQYRNHAEFAPLWLTPLAFALVAAGMAARVRTRRMRAWQLLGHAAGLLCIALGAAGVLYHLESSFFYERTIRSLTYAAPFAAPLAYVGLGCLLIMNRVEDADSRAWAEWVVFLTAGGFAGNFVLSLTDHATNGFYRASEWIPVASSALAVGFLLVVLLQRATRGFLWLCALVCCLQAAVGGLGFLFHLLADAHGPSASFYENVVSGAPPFAPLLLPNLAILGLLGILACARHIAD